MIENSAKNSENQRQLQNDIQKLPRKNVRWLYFCTYDAHAVRRLYIEWE